MKNFFINIRLYAAMAFLAVLGFMLLSGFCAISEIILFAWMMLSFLFLISMTCILESPKTKAEKKLSDWAWNAVKWFSNENMD